MSEEELGAGVGEEQQSTGAPDGPPVTGDPGVDRILSDLERQLRGRPAGGRADGRADGQVEGQVEGQADGQADGQVDGQTADHTDPVPALTAAHRRLQAQLSDPGPTPPTGG